MLVKVVSVHGFACCEGNRGTQALLRSTLWHVLSDILRLIASDEASRRQLRTFVTLCRLQNGGLQRPNVRLDPLTASQVTIEVSTK